MIDVCAMGELLIDFAVKGQNEYGYPIFEGNPGGAPCNFLAALRRYGAASGFIGKVGKDAFGDMLIKTLKEAGIDVRGVVRTDKAFTTLAFVTFEEGGERRFSFSRKPGADTMLCYEECDLKLIDEARVFHFGSLSLTDEPARTTTRKLVEYAESRGKLISYDPNLRRPLWEDLEKAREEIRWGLSKADIIKISDEEIEFLFGLSPEEGAERIFSETKARLIFVTMGPRGTYYSNRKDSGYVDCPEVEPVDTTGAGDIFFGSALSRILRAGKSPEELSEKELRQAALFGTAAASLSTEHMGGIYSIRDMGEVLSRMERES